MTTNCHHETEKRINEHLVVRFGAAALFTTVTLSLALWLGLGVTTASVLCFCGIVLSALYAGLMPALLSLLISTAALSCFFLEPYAILPWDAEFEDLFRLGIFVIVALITSCFAAGSREALKLLRLSEEWHEFLAASALDGIMGVGGNEKILFVNSTAERLLGYSAQEIVGQKLSQLIANDSWRPDTTEIRRYLQTRCNPAITPTLATEPGGRSLRFELSVRVFRNGKRMVFVFREIGPAHNSQPGSTWPNFELAARPNANLTVSHCEAPEIANSWAALSN